MNIVIFGQTGTGKSTFARKLVKYLIEDKRLVVISENIQDIERLADELEFDISLVEITDKNIYQLDFRKLIEQNKYIAFEFEHVIDEELVYALDQIASTIYELKDTLLYIDEAHIFFPKFRCSTELERLIRAGRKNAIINILVTQQLRDLRDVALKQAHYMVVFKLSEHNEIEKIKYYFDVDLLKNLGEYECVIYNKVTGEAEISKSDIIDLMV